MPEAPASAPSNPPSYVTSETAIREGLPPAIPRLSLHPGVDHRQPALHLRSPGSSKWRALQDIFRTSKLAFGDESRQRYVKQLRAAVRALIHFRTWRHWHAFLSSSPFAGIGQHHPRFYEKPFRPYLHRDLTSIECYRMLREHYYFLQQHAPPDFIQALVNNQPFVLNERTIVELKNPLFINLCYAKHNRQEGELTLSIGTRDSLNTVQEHAWIASLTFVIHYGASGWEILVGGVQGGHAGGKGKAEAKLATHVFYGMRPKFLLIEVLQQIASSWGISHIYAVGDDAHVFKRRRYRNRVIIRASYSELWTAAGGVPVANGFFLLPRERCRRPIEEISTHKRAEYKRRYHLLDAIHQEIGDKLGLDAEQAACSVRPR